MAVQHSLGFRVGLIDGQMQGSIHRGAFADDAVDLALDQIAAADEIGATAGGSDPKRIAITHRGVTAVRIVKTVLAQPEIVSNEIVFDVHAANYSVEIRQE